MSISPKLWMARDVSTTVTNRTVGPSIGSVTLVNRIHGLAPSTTADSYNSCGTLCSAAVMTMKVNPRLAQTLLTTTAGRAQVGEFSRPGDLTTSKGRMSASKPTDGCKSTNQMI